MLDLATPYDEFPYRSLPIEWSAPERLALASLLHGGPRVPLEQYRVLELGCGDGANLLPLAYYRRNASFVGLDGAGRAIETANQHRSELDLPNLEFIHADFDSAASRLSGSFEFILVHGVLSWVPEAVRDGLLALCADRLREGGLLYFNYNARPGWNIRGMVRDFLLKETTTTSGLRARAELAQRVAGQMAAALAAAPEHPYARLMEREFRFVCEGHPSYVAHEFLAAENHAYWRSAFLALLARHHLHYVADADFNYASGRIAEGLPEGLTAAGLLGAPREDTVDLLSYRQMHSPVLTRGTWSPRPPSPEEFADLHLASRLVPVEPGAGPTRLFRHPSGIEVEVKDQATWNAFEQIAPLWPTGVRIGDVLADVEAVMSDLRLLHRHGLIELRLAGSSGAARPSGPLNQRELAWGAYTTTAYHTVETVQP